MRPISVVVPVSAVKRGTRLRNCLASVRRQNVPVDVELVVAWVQKKEKRKARRDFEWLCKKYDAKLVEGISPQWEPAFSRNLGFRETTGGILCCLDADAVLHPGTLRCVLSAINKHRNTAIRAPTRMKNEGPQGVAFQPKTSEKIIRKAMLIGKIAPGPGSLIAAPREAVFAIRGWDERFYGYGPADWDYYRRLVQWGCRPETTVREANIYAMHQYHKPRKDVKNKSLRARNRRIYRNTLKAGRPPVRNKNQSWGGEK